jgi:hypothetical protein
MDLFRLMPPAGLPLPPMNPMSHMNPLMGAMGMGPMGAMNPLMAAMPAMALAGPYAMAYSQYLGMQPPQRDDYEACVLIAEGLPIDATEREVSHVFRPFSGYRKLKLAMKESSRGTKYLVAKVDFDTAYQATFARTALKHYLFDEKSDETLDFTIEDGTRRRRRDESDDDDDDDSRKRRRSR